MTFTTAMHNSYSEAEVLYRRHRMAFEVLGSECTLCKSHERAACAQRDGSRTLATCFAVDRLHG